MLIAAAVLLVKATTTHRPLLTNSQSFNMLAVSKEAPCGSISKVYFADMHDGDQKMISMHDDQLTIQSGSQDDEEWIIRAQLDATTCTAMIDFNVPGKPSPPPVPLLLTVFKMHHLSGGPSKYVMEFTDPSETIAPSKDLPLNQWVQLQ